MSCRLPHCAAGFRATVFAAVLVAANAAAIATVAQTANSNAGLEGGQDSLFDAILATPNRKTPVPQDNVFTTAPGAQQPAATQKSKTVETAPIMKGNLPEADQ